MNQIRSDDLSPSPSETTVTPLARIRWGEERFRILSANEELLVLESSDGTKVRRELRRDEVQPLVASKTIMIEHGYFNLDGTSAKTGSFDGVFAASPLMDQADMLEDLEWVKMLDADHVAGLVKLRFDVREVLPCGAKPLNRWIRDALPSMNERCRVVRQVADPTIPRKPRKGQLTQDRFPPKITQLKANLAKYRSKGFHILQFRKRYENCGGASKIDPQVRDVMGRVVNELIARNTRFSIAQVRRHIAAELTLLAGRTVRGPCHETVKHYVQTLDQGRIMLGQLGLKRTKEKRGSNAEGPRYTRIGEMVTMDCWKTDIVVLLKKLGIWMRLSRRQKKEWGVRRRVWVCVAMDVSNRKVVGIGFGLSESPELTRRVLRMVGSGTSEEASVVGCQSPPSSGIGIEILATDSGVAFRHGFFTSSALSLVDQLKVGIVGQPWRQAMKERLFRTTKEQALPYFSGLSFGNPVARGDFDAMADASNTLCVFGNGLFRYFFDVYHMSGHRGLDGQPPKNRFDDALEATGMKPAPTDAIRLIAFGLERELPLTSQGLTHMGIEYKAVWLADIFKKRVATTMRVKVDPCDLGHLGVLWDDEWQIVDASPEFFGVGATLWRQKREELARRYGQQAEINFPIVAQALRDTKANADRERLELKWRIRHMTARDYRQKLTASS